MLNKRNNTFSEKEDNFVHIIITPQHKNMIVFCTLKGVSGLNISESQIQLELNEKNIKYGIDQSAISKLVKAYKSASKKFINLSGIVAKGLSVTSSKNGYIEIFIAPTEKVKIQKDGSADFRNINIFKQVKKGDILAKKHPPVPGKNGIDIFNKVVFAEISSEGSIEYGKNIQFNLETQEYIALEDGFFEERENWIDVKSVLQIKSNVGLETGNIDYDGKVHIFGNIERVASVKVKGDIIVDGIIESGAVSSGSSIFSKLGINTKREHEVVALKNIRTNYVENSCIMAHQDILVQNSILGSKVISLKNILMSSAISSIAGSQIFAYGNIEVGVIGNSSGSNVQLTLGKHMLYAEKYKIVKNELLAIQKEFYKKLEKVKEFKIQIKRPQSRLTKGQIINMKKQFNDYKIIANKRDDYQKREKVYREGMYNHQPVKLIVKSKIYPGVEIIYNNNVINIDSEYTNVVFTFDPKTGGYHISPIQK